jgi:hypothetical protein
MEEMPTPRPTHVLARGDYLSEMEAVTAGVPASLPPLAAGAPANRLGLARWLVSADNPLTSRVLVNRVWESYFGTGLVKTSDDFGTQGEPPSHPELLDWLAVEFQQSGWDLKALQRQIVLSATYRQSSNVSPELLQRDPHNRLLARASRFRLDAEAIRDNALAISGLLDRHLGGPSVRPYQPPGLWRQVSVGGNYSSQSYVPSEGRDCYRRGLYTYWKRSLPHPALVAFDAPSREACVVSRPRTNTPLQALVLLNDPCFVEAAQALADRMVGEGGDQSEGRLRHGFQLCTARAPTPDELRILMWVLEEQRQLARSASEGSSSSSLLALPAISTSASYDQKVWTAVANLLLNLDETITRE